MKKLIKKPVVYNLLVVTIFAFILTSLYFMSKSSLVETQTQVLNINRDLAVNEIENELGRIESIILNLDSYITTHEEHTDLDEYITNIVEGDTFLSSIYFGMPDNTIRISSDITFPSNFELTERPWYLKATSEEGIVFTDAFLDVTGEKYIITGAKAVYNEGELLGVIGIDVDLERLSSYVDNDLVDTGGYAFLIDSSDNLIGYVEYNSVQESLESIDTMSISSDIFTSPKGITEGVFVSDIEGRIAYSSIAGTEYILGIFMPMNSIGQDLLVFHSIGFSIAAVILLGGLVVYLIYLRVFRKPLNSLIEDIDKLDKNNNYQYRFPERKGSGFYKARKALNQLLDDTHEFRNQALNNLNKLALRNQKYNLLLDSASDIVFQINNQRQYVEVYGDGLKQLNRVPADFIGKTFEEMYTSAICNTRESCYELVFRGIKQIYSWEYFVNGKTIYYETAMSPLYDIENNIIGAVGVSRDITEQELRYQDMVNISTHDYLTGLRNRKYYIERLDMLDQLKEYPFGVMNIDVNGLKIINDAYGHSVGDEALIKTASVLKENSEEDYIVSRVSGDEFTIILPNCDEVLTKKLKDKLIKGFKNVQVSNLNLSVAIGYHVKYSDVTSVEEIRKLAENDMFRHKITERKSVKNKAISAILKTLTEKYEAEKIHSEIVTLYSKKLGEAINLESEDLRDLVTAAMFHDIGKISIPDNIIRKPKKLNSKEFEIMKTHTEVGYEILRAADEYSDLAIYASSHHERWDGTGYPKGLKGEEIPLFSRIISLADSFEAMTADRSYRKKQSLDFAVKEIVKFSGTQFDPDLAKIFVEKVLEKPWNYS